ncbi:FMRFamide-activated amiloride-sensitive sodium channel [Trichonephila clavata]|uniref:FMRFamide-activated amiloride-sensitive sodium channel n=1 Tax=Trichonephila clavata TaxID=2740835 RepID=A0A8X6FNJ4_TRICU|nr:FMRFamide-activated amiloride-sensitive sodium channel [Trichonephila clavata]
MVFISTRISSRLIKVKVYFEDSEILTIRYKPQFQEVEAFSYIGGFIGIWLGISLVQVADVFESIFRITRFIFKKGSSCSMKSEARTESGVI